MKVVILAGGGGTRLWPLSIKKKPKQLQKLTSEQTMLEDTIDRIDFLAPEDIYIATNKEYGEEVKKLAKNIPEENIIIEPDLRDTATCIGYAAAYLSTRVDPEEVMTIIYADHLVQNKHEFVEKLKASEKVCQKENTINIVEVNAKFPNVNLGYVKVKGKIDEVDGHDVLAFEKFTEKPDLETAKKFVASGEYLWNTGYFMWKISRILNEFKTHQPATYERLMAMKEALEKGKPEDVPEHYSACEKISIDYAIMEQLKPEDVRIIPAELGWSDIGTWSSIHEELAEKEEDNVVMGHAISIDTEGCLLYGNREKPLVTIGLKDLVVVETDTVTLICPKNRSQDVKKIVQEIKKIGREDLL